MTVYRYLTGKIFGSDDKLGEGAMGKVKGLKDYLKDDASLCRKVTYENFMQKEITSNNQDYKMEDAYQSYRKVAEQGYRT